MSEADLPPSITNAEADPQNSRTVEEAYSTALRFIRTGLQMGAGGERMVKVQVKDGPLLGLSGIVPEEANQLEIAEQSLGAPLVTISVIPIGEEFATEAYGIGINHETGEKYMELRPYDLINAPEGTYDDPELSIRFTEQKQEDHVIARGLGKTKISEATTQRIKDYLERGEQVSRKGRPLIDL